MNSIIQLEDSLNKLKENGVVGIKQSFEDEGVLDRDLVTMNQLCKSTGLNLSVKIGGCEAISDIYRCLDLNVNGIVAPMIESIFGLQKFTESIINNITKKQRKNIKFYINIESQQAFKNIENILESPSCKLLSGIVIGRSDLTKSFGYGKQEVMSDHICKVVKLILQKSKELKLKTYMGGNINKDSVDFIEDLFETHLLDVIETRNVILDLEKCGSIQDTLEEMIYFESEWLEFKSQYYSKFSNQYQSRSKEIQSLI
tara:strand:- start:4739 stop:5509 length:771 start_codon:yes stop_codon:yes gene_type:complete